MAQYAGQTANPNFLGLVLAVTSLWLLWRAFVARGENRVYFWLFVSLQGFATFNMLLSHSRASLMMFIIEVLFALIVLGNFRTRLLVLGGLGVAGVIYLALPMATGFVEQYVNKSDFSASADGGGVFFSRYQIWMESLEQAKRGGAKGGGFGVTIGEAYSGRIGASISSGQYGREQGNSQLALIEQTGWTGLVLYGILIACILGEIFGAFGRRNRMDRVALGLLGGGVLGMLVQSVFEAWWVAPGSVEFAIFWALNGAFVAVKRRPLLIPETIVKGPAARFRPKMIQPLAS
jgi:hypothetical protein